MATAIPYLDEVWSVTTGCGDDMASPGCLNCYARRMFGRNLWTQPCPDCDGSGSLGQAHDGREVSCETCGGHEDALGSGTVPQDFTPTFHADRLDQPLHWRKPRVVGVSFMGDLFHEGITFEQRWSVYNIMEMCPQHTFVNLTKRTKARHDFLHANEDTDGGWPLPNLIEMSTVCNQEEADRDVPLLLATPAAVRGISLEPMLGPVEMDGGQARSGYLLHASNYIGLPAGRPRLDWVVLGGETGPGARPMEPEWALDVYRQCKAAGVAFWFKSLGTAPHKKVWDWPNTLGAEMQATHELPAALAEAVRP